MVREASATMQYATALGDCLRRHTRDCVTRTIGRNRNVYANGDIDRTICFIVSGQVKLLLTAASGKECLLAIYTSGDIFGELCLAGIEQRNGTATAMEDTVLRQMPYAGFLAVLRGNKLLEGLANYLAGRLGDQQRIIAELMTVDSEHRLGETLLRLADQLGQHDPRSMRIVQRISHEEFAQMVGTTRPRISEFMGKFHALGMIETTAERHLIVKQKLLRAYLDSI
jgi:CRP/FNR family cyclic AMP-dependent transcriptional regulator